MISGIKFNESYPNPFAATAVWQKYRFPALQTPFSLRQDKLWFIKLRISSSIPQECGMIKIATFIKSKNVGGNFK